MLQFAKFGIKMRNLELKNFPSSPFIPVKLFAHFMSTVRKQRNENMLEFVNENSGVGANSDGSRK